MVNRIPNHKGSNPWALTKGKNMGTVIIMMPAGSITIAKMNNTTWIKIMVPQGPPGIYAMMCSIKRGAQNAHPCRFRGRRNAPDNGSQDHDNDNGRQEHRLECCHFFLPVPSLFGREGWPQMGLEITSDPNVAGNENQKQQSWNHSACKKL